MNFITKKLLFSFTLLACSEYSSCKESITLDSPLLKIADKGGMFDTPIIDILKTRVDFINLVQGTKSWNGAIITFDIANSNHTIAIYCRRPEIIHGATFVVIAPHHKLASTIATPEHKSAVDAFVQQRCNKSLLERQKTATNHSVFTGAYAVNPFTQELLPVYVSDYAIECFDMRHGNSRLAVPAHNSKDLEIAHEYKLPIKLVVDIQRHLQGKKDDMGPVVAAPLLDKHGNLTEAYLGEYSACITINNNQLHDMSLEQAAKYVIEQLEKKNCCKTYSQTMQYSYNNNSYSIKDLTKLESAFKNMPGNGQTQELKNDLQIALNYIHADFFEIGEKFLINLKNTKTLMIALIEEFCEKQGNDQCYLLRWSQLKDDAIQEKEVFKRDIVSVKEFTVFCKDLVNFLGAFAHSCPRALENIRKQN